MKTDDGKPASSTAEPGPSLGSPAPSPARPPTANSRLIVLALSVAGLILLLVIALMLLKPNDRPVTPSASNPNPTPNPVPELPGWKLVWNDEFNGPAGTPPNPAVWGHEIGDGTANGNKGWGNNELEYYTGSPENAAHDGAGNLVITARQVDPATANLNCYYGPCQYTSARLLTANKVDFKYGRIEARIKVPGGAGLWPAFWALGTNIGQVGWPQSGEIDIMETVGRLPNRLFGTIHGPGYSGEHGFGKTIDLPQPLSNDFHTYAIEWQPDKIVWYFDNQPYHTATPANLPAKQWVFNQPFFLILNVAVGGNLGGQVGPTTTFPQTMTIDYVRQYQSQTAPALTD